MTSIPAGCTGTIEIEGLVHEGDRCPLHEDENGRPLRTAVRDLADGDEFSLDGGVTWHTCAVVLFGTVSVYVGGRRDDNAPTIRLEAARDALVVVR